MAETEESLGVRGAAKRLDVSEKYLHKLSPEAATQLAESARNVRHKRALQREEIRFEEFWLSFKLLQANNIYPARRKVERDVLDRTGMKFRFGEANRYLHRAHEIANTSPKTRR
ncbi:hypothetical protein V4C53_37250 [Paraburkholderia azotifigens]|uniref:hypothetical protein n=1 Tax=Paraburkholderia azotifigens TaxID=2057004 RepID=UPI003181BA2A